VTLTREIPSMPIFENCIKSDESHMVGQKHV
jgi:hypothetical protein